VRPVPIPFHAQIKLVPGAVLRFYGKIRTDVKNFEFNLLQHECSVLDADFVAAQFKIVFKKGQLKLNTKSVSFHCVQLIFKTSKN
jgi:hypothetical protein